MTSPFVVSVPTKDLTTALSTGDVLRFIYAIRLNCFKLFKVFEITVWIFDKQKKGTSEAMCWQLNFQAEIDLAIYQSIMQ